MEKKEMLEQLLNRYERQSKKFETELLTLEKEISRIIKQTSPDDATLERIKKLGITLPVEPKSKGRGSVEHSN